MSCSIDKTLRFWDIKAKICNFILKGHENYIHCVCVLEKYQLLASGGADKNIILWDLSINDIKNVLKGHKDIVKGVEFTRDGELLISVSWDKTVRLWDVVKGTGICVLFICSDRLLSVCLSLDQKYVLVGSDDCVVHVWNRDEKRKEIMLSGIESIKNEILEYGSIREMFGRKI